MSDKPPAFQIYPRDLLFDTAGMTNEELGAYVRLLLHAWDPPMTSDGEKPPIGYLPNEPDLLARKAEATAYWDRISGQVLRLFRTSKDGRFLVQKRMVEERQRQVERSKSMSGNGKLGGRPRKPQLFLGFPEEKPKEALQSASAFASKEHGDPAHAVSPLAQVREARGSSARDLFGDASPKAPGKATKAARVQAALPAAARLLGALNAARARVASGCRALSPSGPNLRGIAERLADGSTEQEVEHVIAVREAEVRSNPDAMRWFDAVTPFRPDNFARSLALDEKLAARAAPAPRASRGVAAPGNWNDEGSDL